MQSPTSVGSGLPPRSTKTLLPKSLMLQETLTWVTRRHPGPASRTGRRRPAQGIRYAPSTWPGGGGVQDNA
eukprot:11430038-Heterocapsa_arctica.AAC.1